MPLETFTTKDGRLVAIRPICADDAPRLLGTYLLWQLILKAHDMGLKAFYAWVMTENMGMMKVIKNLGLPSKMTTRYGENYLVVSLVPNYEVSPQ